MFYTIRIAVTFLILMTLITGAAYSGFFIVLGKILFPNQAGGSLIFRNDKIIGSELIGQNFTGKGYFHGRPSNAGSAYDAASSGGSNLAQSNKELARKAAERAQILQKDAKPRSKIPVELVTSSGSGLDPHISPLAAFFQVPRIAKERNISERKLRELINQNLEEKLLGIFGEERVNVLKLNMALDEIR